MGTSALGSMYHQREQLEHANEMVFFLNFAYLIVQVGQVDDKLDTAKHILRSMVFSSNFIYISFVKVVPCDYRYIHTTYYCDIAGVDHHCCDIFQVDNACVYLIDIFVVSWFI